jgi:hypothetical protein
LTGCSLTGIPAGKYAKYPANPYADLKMIAVLPVETSNGLKNPVDAKEFGTIFSTELARFPGVRVIRPDKLAPELALMDGQMTVDDALLLAEKVGADAIVAMTVTDYDPYHPPKMSVQVEVVTAHSKSKTVTAFDIDGLVQAGTWGELPVAVDPKRAGDFAAVFELVRDTRFKPTHFAAQQFAASGYAESEVFPEISESTLYRTDRFWAFVSNEIIREFFGRSPDFKEHDEHTK